jgi:hypothetical protein
MKITNSATLELLLPNSLFPDSKDWTQSDVVGKVEWLLSMYTSAKQEIVRLEDAIEDLRNDLTYASNN